MDNRKGDRRKFQKKPFFKTQGKHAAITGYKKNFGDSVIQKLFKDNQNDLGAEYTLNDVIEIGYPMSEISIDVITSGRPDNIVQEIHLLLCELISTGIDTKKALAVFLGVSINDFILDELYVLLENGILVNSEEEKLLLTIAGNTFIQEKKFVPVTTQEVFKFYFDNFSKEVLSKPISDKIANSNWLSSEVRVDFDFIQEYWWQIVKCYAKTANLDKEIVDLASYKRSIVSRTVQYQKLFVLIYFPKDHSGKKIHLKVYNNEQVLLKRQTEIISKLFSENKYLFDFSKELKDVDEYKTVFQETTLEIAQAKKSGRYEDISTFEHKALIQEALINGEVAVYIESPWIRRATKQYVPAMEFFLNKKDTQLFIAYGIDSSTQNQPDPDTFTQITQLAQKFKGRLHLIHLPTHFKNKFPNRDGSHRKLLIKDQDYYVKGSFNWLSYSGNENVHYAVEEGTQFFDNVKEYWQKVFTEYKISQAYPSF
jgi:hypothetical protein